MRLTIRLGEIACGCVSALLPLVELGQVGATAAGCAIALSSVAVLAAIGGAVGSWAFVRAVAACAIIGNGFVFASTAFGSNVVLWLDAVTFVMFLLYGGLAEAGMRDLSANAVDVHGFRLLVGSLALAGLVALQQLGSNAGGWLVFVAMAAGVGALVLARRNSA